MSVFTADSPQRLGAQPPPPLPDPAGMALERVEAELCTLAGQIAAATSRFLDLLADFDARDGWAGWGVASCAHWLSWRCGLDLRTAHEHVRVARALRELPKVHAAFGQGRISFLTDLTASHPHITPTTIEPHWDGTPLDLPHATDVYLAGWAPKAARAGATQTAN